MSEIIQFNQVRKTFHSENRVTLALNNISLGFNKGGFVALLGSSGSGKSTLIRTICGLEKLDKDGGEIKFNNNSLQINGKLNSNIRENRKKMGVIFQQFNLVPQLNVIDNVLLGLLANKSLIDILLKRFSQEEKALALDCLERVGLADFAYQRASTLSGGQQQRVAIARALTKPIDLLLADEPVASLDPESSRIVMETLQDIAEKSQLTIIVSLHQVEIALRYAKRVVALKHGKCILNDETSNISSEALHEIYQKDSKYAEASPSRVKFSSEVSPHTRSFAVLD